MSDLIAKELSVYCCEALNYQIASFYCPIRYNKRWREYSVRDFQSTSISVMVFCPNCGTHLPSSLRNEWFDLLDIEYELEDPLEGDKNKVPEEFLTDTWWKNRGLKNNYHENDRISRPSRPIKCLF